MTCPPRRACQRSTLADALTAPSGVPSARAWPACRRASRRTCRGWAAGPGRRAGTRGRPKIAQRRSRVRCGQGRRRACRRPVPARDDGGLVLTTAPHEVAVIGATRGRRSPPSSRRARRSTRRARREHAPRTRSSACAAPSVATTTSGSFTSRRSTTARMPGRSSARQARTLRRYFATVSACRAPGPARVTRAETRAETAEALTHPASPGAP